MGERGNAPARLGHAGKVDLRDNEAFALAAVGQDLAPGVDDERMAKTFAAAGQLPVLAGAMTKAPFSMARARLSTCQWASPVILVKAAGMASTSAPACARVR